MDIVSVLQDRMDSIRFFFFWNYPTQEAWFITNSFTEHPTGKCLWTRILTLNEWC